MRFFSTSSSPLAAFVPALLLVQPISASLIANNTSGHALHPLRTNDGELASMPQAHRSIIAARSRGRGHFPAKSQLLAAARRRHFARRFAKRHRSDDYAEDSSWEEGSKQRVLAKDPDEDIPADGDPGYGTTDGGDVGNPSLTPVPSTYVDASTAGGPATRPPANSGRATTSVPVLPSDSTELSGTVLPSVSAAASTLTDLPASSTSVWSAATMTTLPPIGTVPSNIPGSTGIEAPTAGNLASAMPSARQKIADLTSPDSPSTGNSGVAGGPDLSLSGSNSIWQYFHSGNTFFPVAVVATVILGLGALVATVALLQCVARSSRFSKKKGLTLPKEIEDWASGRSTPNMPSISAAASRRASYISEKQAASRRNPDGGMLDTNASRALSVASRGRRPESIYEAVHSAPASATSYTFDKEDFLPHSYDPEPEAFTYVLPVQYFDPPPPTPRPMSVLSYSNARSHTPVSRGRQYSIGLPSRRATPAPTVYPYPDTLPVLQRMEVAAYSRSPTPHVYTSGYRPGPPPRLPSLPSLPNFELSSHAHGPTPSLPPVRVFSQASETTSYQHRMSLLGPRPGRGEQQGVTRASLTEQMLMQQQKQEQQELGVGRGGGTAYFSMPYSVQERRRWERCVT